MRRREFIAGLSGAAVWPVALCAQQGDRVRRIGVLMALDETDPEAKAQLSGFTQVLAESGWVDGRTVRMDVRWAAGSVDRARMYAKELVDLQPDVIFADSTPEAAALYRETRTIPIVFVLVSDPVGEGFVASLSGPGGNMTGFIPQETGMAGKLLQLLKEIAPGVERAAAIFNPDTAPYVGSSYLPLFETASRSLKVEPIAAPVHSDAEIETVITSLGREPGGGLVVLPGVYMNVHRATIILLAARNNVPAVYPSLDYSRDGGLFSYGPQLLDMFRRAAPYVDRILRGTKPADLPIQLPVKFETALNAKAAKILGLMVPQSILLRADEVIE
jgi:putative tryptophan/tyrosine transport system substrate-binding protein